MPELKKINFGAKLTEGEDLVQEWQKENELSSQSLRNQFKSLPPDDYLGTFALVCLDGPT